MLNILKTLTDFDGHLAFVLAMKRSSQLRLRVPKMPSTSHTVPLVVGNPTCFSVGRNSVNIISRRPRLLPYGRVLGWGEGMES